MNILVFNCGSSSLKFRLVQMPGDRERVAGEAQRIGPPTAEPSRIVYHVDGQPADKPVQVPMADHAAAFGEVMKLLAGLKSDGRGGVDAIGHRIAHGGRTFVRHAIVTDANLPDLLATAELAPLHNPPAIAIVQECRRIYPTLPQALVFDTVFHATIPPCARTYALPAALGSQAGLGLAKYGFHGTSHEYVARQAAKMLGKPMDQLNAVSCHLGSGGASLCAIVNGKSVDNTMGYSTLQGLVMSTRCGDLDPAITLGLLARSLGDSRKVEPLLSRKCGVLGLSGRSADIRDVLARAATNDGTDDRQHVAASIYCWRIRKYLGAYFLVVGRPDAVIFTDTIGETVPAVRWAVACDMATLGLTIDPARNNGATKLPADIAAEGSPVRALVIATNEELSIAQYSYALLSA